MAVPLLSAPEQLLGTLHKGTSVVVVEEGLLLIHFQPAKLLLRALGYCCPSLAGLEAALLLRMCVHGVVVLL